MNADDFRDYILDFIFYKYLNEKMEAYANDILEPDKITYATLERHRDKKLCWLTVKKNLWINLATS